MPKGYCPYCGLAIEGDFTYCPSCGKLLPSFKEATGEAASIVVPRRVELVDNILTSMKYSALLFKDLGTLIILAILHIIPLVNLIVTGYIYRVIQGSPESDVLPSFKDLGKLWIDGLKLWAVTFIYMFIPALIIAAASFSLLFSTPSFLEIRRAGIMLRMTGSDFAEFLARSFIMFLPILIGSLILFFLISIILSMGIVHGIKTGNMWKAFSLREILKIISRIGWGKYLLWMFAMSILLVIFSALGNSPLIGWIIIFLLTPPFYVFVARSAAQIYSESKTSNI